MNDFSELTHLSQAHSAVTYRDFGMLGYKTGKEDKWLVIYHPLSFSAPLLFKQATDP